MSSKFVISHLEVQMGPFDEATLKAKWAKGDLLPIDYVYDDVKQDWVLLSERFPWAHDVKEADVIAAAGMPANTILEPTPPPPISEAASRRHRPLTTKTKTAKPTATATEAETEKVAVKTPSPAPTVTPKEPTAPTPAQVAVTAKVIALGPVKTDTEVTLVNGIGELEIPGQLPGEVELKLQNSNLQLDGPLKIQIKSAEPQFIEWTIPPQQTVGEDIEVHVRALDGANRVCFNYDDTFSIHVGGNDGLQFSVVMKQGQAHLRIQHTKAETWSMTFHYSGPRALKLPTEQKIEWQPGPAIKLILDGPQEYSAGYPLKVAVRAVDRFGNLAKSYQGTLVLEVVKAS